MFQKLALENGKAYFYQVGNTQRIVKQWINSCLFSCDYKHKQWTSSPTSWSFCKSKMIFYWSKIDFLLLHKILDLKKKWHFTALYCFLTHIQKSPKVFGLVQNHFGQAKGQGINLWQPTHSYPLRDSSSLTLLLCIILYEIYICISTYVHE